MHPGIFLYKALNTVCNAEVCRVLILDTRAEKPVHKIEKNHALKCQWLDSEELDALKHDSDFAMSQHFIDDFTQFGFLGVSALIDRTVIGILFLVPDVIVARHNSGGSEFNGIRMELPKGVFYLFKVAVKTESRGMRVNAAMMAFAIGQLGAEALTTVVTTTEWTNRSFLKSAESFGFTRCGFTAELVVAGRHFYCLPKAMESSHPQAVCSHAENRMIRFGRA